MFNIFCNPCSSSSSNSSSKSETSEVTPNTLNNTFPRAPSTFDSIRIKCREMLTNALQTGGKLNTTTRFLKSLFTVVYLYLLSFSPSDIHIYILLTDDYIAIGADCEELGAQIEENIL